MAAFMSNPWLKSFKKPNKWAQSIYDTIRLAIDMVRKDNSEFIVRSQIEELNRLAELREKGILTDSEFCLMKSRIS